MTLLIVAAVIFMCFVGPWCLYRYEMRRFQKEASEALRLLECSHPAFSEEKLREILRNDAVAARNKRMFN